MSGRWQVAVTLVGGQAPRALARHKMRSALAAIGIMIGIAAVVWVVAVGRAGSERAEEQLRDLGDNLVWVEAGSRNVNGLRTGTRGTTTLTLEDAQAIQHEAPFIKAMSPQIDGNILVIYGHNNWTTHYRGVSPDFLGIKRWTVASGASFTDETVALGSNVCVLGETVRQKLFGASDPVGKIIRIGVQPFEVLGVLAARGQSATGQDQDDTILLPYTTAQTKIRGRGAGWVDDVLCSAVSPEAVNPAIDRIFELMRQRHHIATPADDDFNIRRPEEVIKAQLETSRTFALLLVTLASVSLLVGGIGIMNVMLASVSERTKEIGVRLAVGATEWAVQLQFLAEAVFLSLFGGLMGVAVSAAGSWVFERWIGWKMSIPPQALVLAVIFSVSVGVVFGFYPARRAAKLDPIQALHHS
jgi:putative ABC transport system permease protein